MGGFLPLRVMGHYYKKLNIWNDAIEIVKSIYQITEAFPESEKFGLISQIRRAGVSIPSNIAEGSSRNTKKHFSHFLTLAQGSIYELNTQLIISLHLKYIPQEEFNKLENALTILNKRIFAFSKKIQSVNHPN